MEGLLKKERDFVLPGDEIVHSLDYLPGRNAFRDGEAILAKRLGVVSVNNRVISVVPLNAVYMPHPSDMVIGEVTDITSNGWIIQIQSPYEAYLPLSGVREFIDTNRTALSSVYALGEMLYAKVSMAMNGSVHLSMQDPRCRKLRSGRIIRINPAKVPRLIGKMGSMITMIKDRTGCRISAGQNGLIWMEGGNEELVLKAIRMIDEEAYKEGLTDRISAMLGPAPVQPKPQGAEPHEPFAGPHEPFSQPQGTGADFNEPTEGFHE